MRSLQLQVMPAPLRGWVLLVNLNTPLAYLLVLDGGVLHFCPAIINPHSSGSPRQDS